MSYNNNNNTVFILALLGLGIAVTKVKGGVFGILGGLFGKLSRGAAGDGGGGSGSGGGSGNNNTVPPTPPSPSQAKPRYLKEQDIKDLIAAIRDAADLFQMNKIASIDRMQRLFWKCGHTDDITCLYERFGTYDWDGWGEGDMFAALNFCYSNSWVDSAIWADIKAHLYGYSSQVKF